MYLGIHENLNCEAQYRIREFQAEAQVARLVKQVRQQTVRLSFRQKVGFRLVRWGLHLAGKPGRYLLYLETEGMGS